MIRKNSDRFEKLFIRTPKRHIVFYERILIQYSMCRYTQYTRSVYDDLYRTFITAGHRCRNSFL